MGLIDFVKSAGERLFGKDETPEAATESPAVLDARKGKALEDTLTKLGFDIDGLEISVAGDVATVKGTVASQEAREKVVLVLGNTAGIGSVDDQLEVEAPEPEATYYTVVSGDSLSKIAKAHYGDAMKYPVIFEANKPMLTDPDKIYPGQVLRIPPLGD